MGIEFKLRKAGIGSEEWRVADPETGCYCIAFSRGNSLNPERAACGWLEDHRERFPGGLHAHYEVRRVMAQDERDELMNEGADEIARLRALLAECAPHVFSAAEAEHLLDGFRPQRRPIDALADRVRAALTHNA